MVSTVTLLAPLFFDDRQNGIGRLSGAAAAAFERHFGTPCQVWGANDALDAKTAPGDRVFAGGYRRMIAAALVAPRPRGIKLVFATHLGLAPVAWILAARWRVRYAAFLSGVECWRRFPFRTEFAMRRASGYCAISHFTLGDFRRAHPNLGRVPARVTHLAMPHDFQTEPPSKRAAATVRVLAVGRIANSERVQTARGMELYKGFRPLIDACELAAATMPDLEVRIVGDGDARAELQSWALTAARRVRVTFLGKLSETELALEYAKADIFSLPSLLEGFGYVFVEAMANGLPCVCLKGTAPEEIVQDGTTGFAARPGDIHDLADKITALAGDAALRRRFGEAGRVRYAEYFTAEHFERRFLAELGDMGLL